GPAEGGGGGEVEAGSSPAQRLRSDGEHGVLGVARGDRRGYPPEPLPDWASVPQCTCLRARCAASPGAGGGAGGAVRGRGGAGAGVPQPPRNDRRALQRGPGRGGPAAVPDG